MEELARRTPLSAAAFSHSVHNTAAGLYSILTANVAPSTATAGVGGTFASGIIETLSVIDRTRAERALLIVGDTLLPSALQAYSTDPSAPYAVAFVLSRGREGHPVTVMPGGISLSSTPWPDALEFLRWMLSSEPSISIGSGRNVLTYVRAKTTDVDAS